VSSPQPRQDRGVFSARFHLYSGGRGRGESGEFFGEFRDAEIEFVAEVEEGELGVQVALDESSLIEGQVVFVLHDGSRVTRP